MLTSLGRVAVVFALLLPSCDQHAVRVDFRIVNDYRFSWTERRTIETLADSAIADARTLLPTLPAEVVLDVRASDDVIAGLGFTGGPAGDTIYWLVDPSHGEGVSAIAGLHLRQFVFLASYQLVRERLVSQSSSLMDLIVSRGLETAFARDFAGARYPWADYPPNVEDWVAELQSVVESEPSEHWMRRHPDGRRWIGVKAGTYLADRAMEKLGKSSLDLVSASTEEMLLAAGYR